MKRFEGKEVLSSGIEIPNAAGGLRGGPAGRPAGVPPRRAPVAKTSGLERVHVFAAEAATFVDQEAERLAAEEAAGVQQLAGVRESAPRRRGRSVAAVDDLDGEG